jgi:hypothetical protein
MYRRAWNRIVDSRHDQPVLARGFGVSAAHLHSLGHPQRVFEAFELIAAVGEHAADVVRIANAAAALDRGARVLSDRGAVGVR